jgi:YNFM family putative membrane transporter
MTRSAVPADTEARPGDGTPVRRLKLAMLFAALCAFALLYATQALLPAVGKAFGVGPTLTSLTVSAATGGLALSIVPLSSLAESLGRVRVMRTGLVTACLMSFVSAVAPTLWTLLVARALVGVALAAVVGVAVGHLGDEVPAGALGTAIGVYVAGNTVGGIAGRLIPGIAESVTTWRVAIAILAGAASLSVAAFWVLLPRARPVEPTPLRLGAHVEAVRDLLRDPGIRRLCAVAFLLMGGFVACYNYLTFRLEAPPLDIHGALVSLLFLAYVAGTVSSPLAGRLADQYGGRLLICGSIAVALAGLALTLPNQIISITVGLLVFTAGFFAAHAVASGWVAARATRGRGQGAGLYLMSYYLGSSAFGALVGLAFQRAGWPGTTGVIAVLFVAAALCVAGVRSP